MNRSRRWHTAPDQARDYELAAMPDPREDELCTCGQPRWQHDLADDCSALVIEGKCGGFRKAA